MSATAESTSSRPSSRPQSEASGDLAMCLLAKNVREHVRPCLESFAAHVHEIVVVDLGSRDGATAEIRKVCRERGWADKLVLGRAKSSLPVVDARNYAESLASCAFVCTTDFDERVIGAEHLLTACWGLGAPSDVGSPRVANAFLYEHRDRDGHWTWRQRVTRRGVFPFVSATERSIRGGIGTVDRRLCYFAHHSQVSGRDRRRRPRVPRFVETYDRDDLNLAPTLTAQLRKALGQSLWGGRGSPEPKRLDDGTLGYYPDPPWRSDRCFASNLATLLQVPLEEVPDSGVDARLAAGGKPADVNDAAWTLYVDWLAGRGLEFVAFEIYPDAPVPRDRWIDANPALPVPDRWIGVLRNAGLFQDHVVVMRGHRFLFDPYGSIKGDDDPKLHPRLYYGLAVGPSARRRKRNPGNTRQRSKAK